MRLLTCRKETRSAAETAGYKAIGQETNDSLRKPFQYGRGVAARYSYATRDTSNLGGDLWE